jgi:hypothetical protein
MLYKVIFILLLLQNPLGYTADEFIETLENTYLVEEGNNAGITKIVLDPSHKRIKIWESCIPKDCDWGIVTYNQNEENIEAIYAMGDVKKLVNLSLSKDRLILNADIKYVINQKAYKTVSYTLKSQKNRKK